MLPVIRHAIERRWREGGAGDRRAAAADVAAAAARAHARSRGAAAREGRRFGGDGRRGAEAPLAGLRDAHRPGRAASLPAGGGAGPGARTHGPRIRATAPCMRSVATRSTVRSDLRDDCRPLVIPADESLSIDTPEDWAEAERRCWLEIFPSERPATPRAAADSSRRQRQLAEMQAAAAGTRSRGNLSPAGDDRRRAVAGGSGVRVAVPGAVPAMVCRRSGSRPIGYWSCRAGARRRGIGRSRRATVRSSTMSRRKSSARSTTSAWRRTGNRSRRGC